MKLLPVRISIIMNNFQRQSQAFSSSQPLVADVSLWFQDIVNHEDPTVPPVNLRYQIVLNYTLNKRLTAYFGAKSYIREEVYRTKKIPLDNQLQHHGELIIVSTAGKWLKGPEGTREVTTLTPKDRTLLKDAWSALHNDTNTAETNTVFRISDITKEKFALLQLDESKLGVFGLLTRTLKDLKNDSESFDGELLYSPVEYYRTGYESKRPSSRERA